MEYSLQILRNVLTNLISHAKKKNNDWTNVPTNKYCETFQSLEYVTSELRSGVRSHSYGTYVRGQFAYLPEQHRIGGHSTDGWTVQIRLQQSRFSF
jgi:hypothetical protein